MVESTKPTRVNLFLTILAILLSLLLGYWTYYVAKECDYDIECLIISTLCYMATLIPTMGFQYGSTRLGVNIRILCVVLFVLFLAINFSYAIAGISMPSYIIVNGVVLIIYLAVFYKMQNIKSI